jgi:hypothetical protein
MMIKKQIYRLHNWYPALLLKEELRTKYQYLAIGSDKSKAIQNIIDINKTWYNVSLFSSTSNMSSVGTSVSTDDCNWMGTNCTRLLADLFPHAYEADFLRGLHKNKNRKLA